MRIIEMASRSTDKGVLSIVKATDDFFDDPHGFRAECQTFCQDQLPILVRLPTDPGKPFEYEGRADLVEIAKSIPEAALSWQKRCSGYSPPPSH